jgi:signal transduction histidine kinase/CheY-like chemotaxis protein
MESVAAAAAHTIAMLNATTTTGCVDGMMMVPSPTPLSDLLITVAYFSIPFQILFSLYRFPFLKAMPLHIVLLLVLFAFFIFLCGAGHLLHHLQMQHTPLFARVNTLTALVSVTTALYLLPIIPNLFSTIDAKIQESIKLNHETAESKDKLVAFMAFLCHEIRNPLFAITSSVQSLREDYTWTGEPAECLESIHDASLLMLRLVNDVLDLSKMDAGKLTLEEREFDFQRLLQNLETCIERQLVGMHGDDVTLQFRVEPSVPQMLFGDSTRILQIVYNILSNSVKFTTSGSIRFSVRVTHDRPACSGSMVAGIMDGSNRGRVSKLAKTAHGLCQKDTTTNPNEPHDGVGDVNSVNVTHLGKGGNAAEESEMASLVMEEGIQCLQQDHRETPRRKTVYLHITCQDTGVGIAPDRIKTIFEPYSQAKLSDYRKHGGTGLGLSVISSLLRIMGGTIQVHSVVGEGSTFDLVIPMQAPIDQPPRVPASGMSQQDVHYQTHTLPQPSLDSTLGPQSSTISASPRQRMSRRKSVDSDTIRATRRLPPLCYDGESFTNRGRTNETYVKQEDPIQDMESPTTSSSGSASDDDGSADRDIVAGASASGQTLPPPASLISLVLASAQPMLSTSNLSVVLSNSSRDNSTLDYQKIERRDHHHFSSSPPCSSFIVKPRQQVPARAKSSASSSVDAGATSDGSDKSVDGRRYSKQVLVADDNVVNRKIIGKMLTNFGIDFDLAAHGGEAVDHVRGQSTSRRDYGLVFMDLSMPVMDGYDAIQVIRSEYPSLPIVALTANALTQEKQRAMRAGATEFRTKPILRHDLLAVCDHYLLPPMDRVQGAASPSSTPNASATMLR